jgi:hypothetical protein
MNLRCWIRAPSRNERLPRVVALGVLHVLLQALGWFVLAAIALHTPDPRVARYRYADSPWLDGYEDWLGLGFGLAFAAPFLIFLGRLVAARWRPTRSAPRTYLWLQTVPGALVLGWILLDSLAKADRDAALPPPLAFEAAPWIEQTELRSRMLGDLVERTRFVGSSRVELERLVGPAVPVQDFADLTAPLAVGCPETQWPSQALGFQFDPVSGRCVRAIWRGEFGICSELR